MTSHVDEAVAARIAAARRRTEEQKRIRAEFAAARTQGLARRHAAKLRAPEPVPRVDPRPTARRATVPIVNLRADHLPADIAPLLEAYLKTGRAAAEARHRATTGPVAERAAFLDEAEQTAAAAQEALAALEAATRTGNRQLLESAAGSFLAHVENARSALATAEAEMRSAAAAAALYATAQVRGGKPVLDIDTQAAARSQGKARCMNVVSDIRDLFGVMPEDVEG